MSQESFPLLHLSEMQPPVGLLEKVLGAIFRARMRRLYVVLGFAIAGCAASTGYIFFRLSAIVAEVQQSSFFEMLRMLDTDADVLLLHVKEYSLAVIETTPMETVLSSLVVLFCCMSVIAVSSSLRRMKKEFYIHHHTTA